MKDISFLIHKLGNFLYTLYLCKGMLLNSFMWVSSIFFVHYLCCRWRKKATKMKFSFFLVWQRCAQMRRHVEYIQKICLYFGVFLLLLLFHCFIRGFFMFIIFLWFVCKICAIQDVYLKLSCSCEIRDIFLYLILSYLGLESCVSNVIHLPFQIEST